MPVFFVIRTELSAITRERQLDGTCNGGAWPYAAVCLAEVPEFDEGLRSGVNEANRSYSCLINFKENWGGYPWRVALTSFPWMACKVHSK